MWVIWYASTTYQEIGMILTKSEMIRITSDIVHYKYIHGYYS